MDFVEYMQANGHEELAIWTDPPVGLKAFVAIHDRTLGPALGGTRIWPHRTTNEAIADVLRLSKAMTYKAAAAGLPLGGGKAVIIADPKSDKTEGMFRSYGRFVESFNGRYVTTEDVGATAQDMEWISYETRHVVGLPEELGGSGNPATVTGFGVFQAMRACAETVWGTDSLQGRRIAIQGFGNVASSLAAYLLDAGAELIVTDIHQAALRQAKQLPRTTTVAVETIYDTACDIFAPCALGGVLNHDTIPRLRCSVICGAANNQLAEAGDADLLTSRSILYAPDYIANAGGVTNVFYELERPYNRDAALAKTARIYNTMKTVLDFSSTLGLSTAAAADKMAEDRLGEVKAARNR